MNKPMNLIRRFTGAQRLEHLVLFISFTALALTGLPQKFSQAGISQALITLLGGIETVRIIHRIMATIFVLEAVYHLVVVGYKFYVLRLEASMIPGPKDITDALGTFTLNLGISKKHPKMPRYNFSEKVEYWAMLWGLLLMGLTGFMLWNPLATTRLLPGEIIPAAKAAHGAEAILAVLAIILWHFYNVHIKSWNWGMIKGTLNRNQMAEEHGQELEAIEQGKAKTPDTSGMKQRQTLFVPLAAVFSLAAVFLVVKFITFEQTSITTIPPAEQAQVYVPQTPTPVPTPEPTITEEPTLTVEATQPGAPTAAAASGATWDSSIGAIFQASCGMCHGSSGGLSVKTYADLMKGGDKGAAIVPGNPDGSLLVQTVKGGTHPGKFTDAELQQVIDWIQAGALEK